MSVNFIMIVSHIEPWTARTKIRGPSHILSLFLTYCSIRNQFSYARPKQRILLNLQAFWIVTLEKKKKNTYIFRNIAFFICILCNRFFFLFDAILGLVIQRTESKYPLEWFIKKLDIVVFAIAQDDREKSTRIYDNDDDWECNWPYASV